MAGPSRTKYSVGIRASEWIVTGGGDGFQTRFDPQDENIVYSMSQNGDVVRLDKHTGISAGIRPTVAEGAPQPRWHWDTPFIISSFSHKRLYLAGSRLYRSDDRGDHWQTVSDDLTRQLDADNQLVMGQTWEADAVQKNRFTSPLSVCTALAESPLKEGLLYVGTDDGLVQISTNGGENWRRSPDRRHELSLHQPEELPSAGWGDGDRLGRAVVHGCREHRQPVGRVDVAVLLERVAGARRGPHHQHRVRGCATDGQQRSARRLHRDEAPEAAHHGIRPATQRAAGIWLADGAADGIHTAGAGAAAASDLGPVNGVLGVEWRQCQQAAGNGSASGSDMIFHFRLSVLRFDYCSRSAGF